jgi:hypothetical protein
MVRSVGRVAFLVDLGAGDSSTLFNTLVIRDSSTVGGLAHFQAGALIWLPGRSFFESAAYEQLPIGNQTVYSTAGPPNAPNHTVVTTTSESEDNGITTSAGIPLTDNITLSGYYNRSIRQRTDTVSMSLTYVLRGTPRRRALSMIDRALREAEGAGQ